MQKSKPITGLFVDTLDNKDLQKALGSAIREARTEKGLSQDKLAEILGMDGRTILKIEKGESNLKFENLHPLIRYLKIPTERVFYPDSDNPGENLQKLHTLLNGCTEQDAERLLPMFRCLLDLLHGLESSQNSENQ